MIDSRSSRARPRVFVAAVMLLLCAAGSECWGQTGYGGPSILSRGGNRPGRRGRAPVDFTYYLGARATAESGLLAPQLNASGGFDSPTVYGGSVEGGLYGGHDWKTSSLGVDYRGDYRHNTRLSQFNGANHALAVDYQRQLTRHTMFMARETGGTTNRAFGSFAAPAFAEAGRLGVPLNEVFDVRTYYSQTSAGVAYMKSARLTFTGQGQVFFTKRQNLSLTNGQGGMASGIVNYRLTRRTDIGGVYEFTRFGYPHVDAGADAHTAAFSFGRRITRSLDVNVIAGGIRISSYGTQLVELSPEVAFILGRQTGYAAFSRVLYRPRVDATLTHTYARSRFRAGYFAGIGGGNGIYLTTYRHSVHGGYSYAGLKRMSLGLSAGWTRTSSVDIRLGTLEHYQFGGGFSYRLREHLNFNAQLDRRTFNSPGVRGRDGFAASIGLSVTPSRLPISIW